MLAGERRSSGQGDPGTPKHSRWAIHSGLSHVGEVGGAQRLTTNE
jgi:hypothetical protein